MGRDRGALLRFVMQQSRKGRVPPLAAARLPFTS